MTSEAARVADPDEAVSLGELALDRGSRRR